MSDNTDLIISRSKKCIVKIMVIVWVMAVLCVDDKVFWGLTGVKYVYIFSDL